MNSNEILRDVKTTLNPAEEKFFREICLFVEAVRLNEIRNAKPVLEECAGIHIMAMFSIILRIMKWRDEMLTGWKPTSEKYPISGRYDGVLDWVKNSFAFKSEAEFPHSAATEKNICLAMADFADYIGMNRNEFMYMFPVVLRLFGVETQWSGIVK